MESTVKRTVSTLRAVETHDPDFVEIRFDGMKSISKISEIRNATRRPLIATNRSRNQGGLYSGTKENTARILEQAAEVGFDYVDVELTTKGVGKTVTQLKQYGTSVMVSYHDRMLTPSLTAFESILDREKRTGADICKIVGTAKYYVDCLRCLTFVSKHAQKAKLVCFSMGRLGIPSRVMSPIFGAHFTFASPSSGRETAPGQLPIDKLRALYRELEVT
jgi:3-dehydroquinate dehydratase type I